MKSNAIIPTIMLDEIPYTRTGPATVNIFAPTPITYPSDLYSIAGETIELANPVIGTRYTFSSDSSSYRPSKQF